MKEKQTKEERDRRELYEAIQGRLFEMRDCLKCFYADRRRDELEEAVLAGVVKGIHDIETIFFDVVVGGNGSIREILEFRKEELERRILPV